MSSGRMLAYFCERFVSVRFAVLFRLMKYSTRKIVMT